MSYEVLATICGQLQDKAAAEQFAGELRSLVDRHQPLGCVVQIRNVRQNVDLLRSVTYPRAP